MKSTSWMSGRKLMSADTARYLDLLEQRIVLLGSLADALVSAGASISAFDIDGLEARIATQQQLARRLARSEEHTSELQSLRHLVCRLLLEKKNSTRPVSRTWLRDHR